jgi:hypothetical protein
MNQQPRHVPKAQPATRDDAPKAKPNPHPLARFLGTRVVVTTRAGTLIEGDFSDVREGTITLEQCRIVGTRHVALVDQLVMFVKDNVSHVNSLAREVTTTTTEGDQ